MEGWKDIKGYEGLYEMNNKMECRNKRTGKYLKPWCGVSYCLYKNGKKKQIDMSHLMYETFKEEIEKGGKFNG